MSDDLTRDLVDEIECAADQISSAVSSIKTIIQYGGYKPAITALPFLSRAVSEAMALVIIILGAKNNARLS